MHSGVPAFADIIWYCTMSYTFTVWHTATSDTTKCVSAGEKYGGMQAHLNAVSVKLAVYTVSLMHQSPRPSLVLYYVT